MARKNATAVSVMPVWNDPDARLLQQIFRMTTEEYLFLKFLASAPRPSECTARQRTPVPKVTRVLQSGGH